LVLLPRNLVDYQKLRFAKKGNFRQEKIPCIGYFYYEFAKMEIEGRFFFRKQETKIEFQIAASIQQNKFFIFKPDARLTQI
jgi:hypothetical protein